MKLFTATLMAAFVAVVLTQEASTQKPEQTTQPSTTTTNEPTPTTTTSTSTTEKPVPTTTEVPSTSTAPPKPKEATLTNYTVYNGDEVCAFFLMRVTVADNTTSYPFANPQVKHEDSKCDDSKATLWIESEDAYTLQLDISHDATNFFVEQISAGVPPHKTAMISNLTQFSTPMKQYYKCTARSEVQLGEESLRVIFSDMSYQAFHKGKDAGFSGDQFECVADTRSDVVIIAIGCALALLVIVILIAYLIARRRNRQRGYQSV